MGKIFLLIGGIFMIIGIVMLLAENGEFKWLSWFGNLPGDIRIEKENFRLFFPLTSMLILSIILSLLLRIIKRYF
ncbi:MAG: hypothetical protein KatS3mg027_0868 [Bacteroidia bacterium]|nr:MAG: hypothetical protein KatS3mg027_0868 [Bacteroidia bacterium]